MRKLGIIAVLSLLLVAATAVVAQAAQTTTIDPANAPSGAHLQTGTISCSVDATTMLVSCSTYELAGLGNADAKADLAASYSATVNCTNNGGHLVPVKASVQTAPTSTGQIPSENGRLTVPALNSGPVPTAESFAAMATCPNGNWTATTDTSTITLESFTYTVTFVDKDTGLPLYPGPYISITGNDP